MRVGASGVHSVRPIEQEVGLSSTARAFPNRVHSMFIHLSNLPAVSTRRDKRREIEVDCDMDSPEYKLQIAEYANPRCLDQMMAWVPRAIEEAVLYCDFDTRIKLVSALRIDREARTWFMTKRYSGYLKSVVFWDEDVMHRLVAKVVGPLTKYQRIERKLERYRELCQPLYESIGMSKL